MGPGVGLDRGGRAAVGVALAQHRVHGRALDRVVARADVALLVGRRAPPGSPGSSKPCSCSSLIARLSWGTEALMFGSLMMFASGVLASSPSSVSASGRCSSREVGELGQDAPGERDVAQLDLDAGGRGEPADDRQQRARRERGGLVGLGVDDLHGPRVNLPAATIRDMFGGGGSIQLARVFGIRVGVEPSWFLILFLIIWSLTGYYGDLFPGEGTNVVRAGGDLRAAVLRQHRAARAGPRGGGHPQRDQDRGHRPVAVRRRGQAVERDTELGRRGVPRRRRRARRSRC